MGSSGGKSATRCHCPSGLGTISHRKVLAHGLAPNGTLPCWISGEGTKLRGTQPRNRAAGVGWTGVEGFLRRRDHTSGEQQDLREMEGTQRLQTDLGAES